MKIKSLTLLALIGICLVCGQSSYSEEKKPAKQEGHHHAGKWHTHGAGDDVSDKQFPPAKVVKATKNSPEYIDLANNVQIIEQVTDAAVSDSSVFTHEGSFAPLLLGKDLRSFSLKLEPGMFLAEHPHSTGSMVYTVSGQWVLCSEGKRQVMKAGSVFWFGPNMPTGWEAPFPEGAVLLIVKTMSSDETNYESFVKVTHGLSADLDKQYKNGGVFYYHQLKENHPAIVFAKKHNPKFNDILKAAKK